MTNRFLPVLTRTTRVCETSFHLCSEEYAELSKDFEDALMALEQRHADEILLLPVQQPESFFEDDSFGGDGLAPYCFDASGLLVGFEIDVSWL